MGYGIDYKEMTLDEYLKEKKEEYLCNKEHESFKNIFSKYDDVVKNIVKSKFVKVIDEPVIDEPYYYVTVIHNLEELKLEHTKALMCAEILQCAIDAAKKSMDMVMEVMKDGSEKNDN